MKGISLPINNRGFSYEELFKIYIVDKKSVAYIASHLKCSQNKINYWLLKHGIKKRSIADAMYLHKNPLGDPFAQHQPKSLNEGILFGMGLGLYWGEGSKRGTGGVRITNSDPRLLNKFIEFLETFFGIERSALRFSLQVFNDISLDAALNYWIRELRVKRKQFYKVIVSKVRGDGTYRYRSEHGVIIVYFNNIKLKRIICGMIDNMK